MARVARIARLQAATWQGRLRIHAGRPATEASCAPGERCTLSLGALSMMICALCLTLASSSLRSACAVDRSSPRPRSGPGSRGRTPPRWRAPRRRAVGPPWPMGRIAAQRVVQCPSRAQLSRGSAEPPAYLLGGQRLVHLPRVLCRALKPRVLDLRAQRRATPAQRASTRPRADAARARLRARLARARDAVPARACRRALRCRP